MKKNLYYQCCEPNLIMLYKSKLEIFDDFKILLEITHNVILSLKQQMYLNGDDKNVINMFHLIVLDTPHNQK